VNSIVFFSLKRVFSLPNFYTNENIKPFLEKEINQKQSRK